MSRIHIQEANQIVKITQPGLNDHVEKQFQGKALGSSSTINGSAFIAHSQAGIDAWAQLGNQKWTYDALLPFTRQPTQSSRLMQASARSWALTISATPTNPLFLMVQFKCPFPALPKRTPWLKLGMRFSETWVIRQQLTSSPRRVQAIDATQLLLTRRQRNACLQTHNMAAQPPHAPTLLLSPRQQCSKSCSRALCQRRPLRKVLKCPLMATPVRLRQTKKSSYQLPLPYCEIA